MLIRSVISASLVLALAGQPAALSQAVSGSTSRERAEPSSPSRAEREAAEREALAREAARMKAEQAASEAQRAAAEERQAAARSARETDGESPELSAACRATPRPPWCSSPSDAGAVATDQ